MSFSMARASSGDRLDEWSIGSQRCWCDTGQGMTTPYRLGGRDKKKLWAPMPFHLLNSPSSYTVEALDKFRI
ncbi:hypothetical protein V6N13_072590 [Hibiscus sabdariffa]